MVNYINNLQHTPVSKQIYSNQHKIKIMQPSRINKILMIRVENQISKWNSYQEKIVPSGYEIIC